MTFPLINNIYSYKNMSYIVWYQIIGYKVYVQEVIKEGNARFLELNWWDFMWNATKIGKIQPKIY